MTSLLDPPRSIAISSTLSLPLIVAEIGCNHGGNLETAREMIRTAKLCGADVVKFQKRNPRELLTPEQYNKPYDNPHSFGATYGEHREALEFSAAVHGELKAYAESLGIEYAASVWDATSAREITALQPRLIKVPSACNNHWELLRIVRDAYAGEVHVSLGMTRRSEEEALVRFFDAVPQRLVLYACTSGYPIAMDDVCLLEIPRLIETYRVTGRCQAVGFSGHHLGIAVDIAATVLGAAVIERHFTLDRTSKGTDHAASLEPEGLRKLVRDIKAVARAWSLKPADILPVEAAQRAKLRYQPPASS